MEEGDATAADDSSTPAAGEQSSSESGDATGNVSAEVEVSTSTVAVPSPLAAISTAGASTAIETPLVAPFSPSTSTPDAPTTSSIMVPAVQQEPERVSSPAGSTSSSTSVRARSSTAQLLNSDEGERRLSLLSPAFANNEVHFVWRPPAPSPPRNGKGGNGKNTRNDARDVIEVMKIALLRNKYLWNAFKQCPGWKDVPVEIEKFMDSVDIKDFSTLQTLVQKFNTAVKINKNMFSGQTIPENIVDKTRRAEHDLLRVICDICYQRSVPDASQLNRCYEAFSSQVYGETNVDQLHHMIQQGVLREGEKFVDLGSGIGNVIVYVAGALKMKKLTGIEISDYPAECATRMKKEFAQWMKWFGKEFQPFELHHGDFLDEKFRATILEADVIFINNFAFNSDLENRIKNEIICELKQGTRIISTKAYAKVGREFTTDRDVNIGDVSSILKVSELSTVESPASWTGKKVHFFLHEVDFAKLQEHFDVKNENSQSGRCSDNSSRKSSKSRSSSEAPASVGSVKEEDEGRVSPLASTSQAARASFTHRQGDEDDGGPTTRHRYNQFMHVFDENKKRKKGSAGSEAPRWDEEDFDYEPPEKKKQKKEPKPKTPKQPAQRKSHPPKARMGGMGGGGAAKGSIMDDDEVPHSIHGAARLPPARLSGDAKEGLHILHEEIIAQGTSDPPLPDPDDPTLILTRIVQPPAGLPAPAPVHAVVMLDATDPVDRMLLAWRAEYRAILHALQHPDPALFRDLHDAINHEKQKQTELREKERATLSAIENLLATANMHLRARLKELDMSEVETPSELLNLSKMIVARHKEITYQCSMLESEVATLESRLRATQGPEVADRLIELTYRPDLSYEDVANTLCELGVGVEETVRPLGAAATARGGRAHAPRSRPRTTAPKRTAGTATAAARAAGGDTEQSEDIDRKVKEFVAKVESAAKEKDQKERRARGADKKKASTASASQAAALAAAASSSTVAATVQPTVIGVSSSGVAVSSGGVLPPPSVPPPQPHTTTAAF